MFENYFKLAYRHLLRDKWYSAINITGLAVGIACCFVALLYVRHEYAYDTFHVQADRIYRLVRERKVSEHEWNAQALSSWNVTALLQKDFPQIGSMVRISRRECLVGKDATQFRETGFFMADSNFFHVFSFPLIQGDPETALRAPFSIVLTESSAEKYFGQQNPMGKTLRIDNKHDYLVTGIAADPPVHSHVHFDFLASMSSALQLYAGNREMFESWGALWLYTYVLLKKEVDPVQFEQQFAGFIDRHAPFPNASQRVKLHLQALTAIHLQSHLDGEIEANSSASTVRLLALIAFFILALACINFTNLATARASRRVREIGMRKVAGAHRLALVGQFLSESVLQSVLALVLGAAMVWAALPFFENLIGKPLAGDDTSGTGMLALGLGLALFSGIAAGSYPAFYLSSLRPALILKGAGGGGKKSAVLLRQGLVVTQFTITVALMIATTVVFRQLQFIRQKDLGFDQEQVLVIDLNNKETREKQQQLKEIFRQAPAVLDLTCSSNTPTEQLNSWNIDWEGRSEVAESSIRILSVDWDYVKTMGLQMADGRNLSQDFPTDAAEGILLNEAAVREFGFSTPLGVRLKLSVNREILKTGTVVGVVRDFHLASLHEEIRPLALLIHPSWYDRLSVRIRPGAAPQTLAYLENRWKQVAPAWPFEYHFLDEQVDRLYRADRTLGALVAFFTAMAIFIACLGLLGLAAYTAQRRIKEIGIRKVLGASVAGIAGLLAKDFLKLVLISILIASPIAFYVLQGWLQQYAYRIELAWWMFVAAGAGAVLTAGIAVSFQSVRAALINPVDTFRSE